MTQKMIQPGLFKKRYIAMAGILMLLALTLLILPEKYGSSELPPDRLMLELIEPTRLVSPDDLAQKMVNKDPFIQLIDVRSVSEFTKFSLPGAINIPLENLLDKDSLGNLVWEPILNQDVKTNIFYSNGQIYANQAWMLSRRLNYKNNYILQGGLNKWVETIMRPPLPPQTASQSDIDLYKTRKAASAFFGGGGTRETTSESSEKSENAPVKKTPKKKSGGGGC